MDLKGHFSKLKRGITMQPALSEIKLNIVPKVIL